MRRPAYTLIELIATIVIVAIVCAIVVPILNQPRKTASQRKNPSQLRGLHQAMVIYSLSNNACLPGMASDGSILPAGLTTTGSLVDDGSVAGARCWILLTGGFIAPALFQNPQESLTLWTTGRLTTANLSYAMLRITSTPADYGRRAEWHDNANGAAALVSDRNAGLDSTDAKARSLWPSPSGNWRGDVVWGDNHLSFEPNSRLTTTTIYNGIKQTHDNLFATLVAPGVTDNSKDAGANAMMTTTN
ncbi:MAG: type II secretion system protein [Planctomycetota bacterium]|nr:type II secretion system protein [Planctomycetota bacterium]